MRCGARWGQVKCDGANQCDESVCDGAERGGMIVRGDTRRGKLGYVGRWGWGEVRGGTICGGSGPGRGEKTGRCARRGTDRLERGELVVWVGWGGVK